MSWYLLEWVKSMVRSSRYKHMKSCSTRRPGLGGYRSSYLEYKLELEVRLNNNSKHLMATRCNNSWLRCSLSGWGLTCCIVLGVLRGNCWDSIDRSLPGQIQLWHFLKKTKTVVEAGIIF